MAKYKIEWVEKKVTSVGEKWDARVIDSEGNPHDGVTLWLKDWPNVSAGHEVDADLVVKQNGQYTNKTLYAPKAPAAGGFKKSGGAAISAAMDRKEASIGKTMDRKEDAIAKAASFRDATLIVVNLYPELSKGDGFDSKEELIKAEWSKWQKFFESQWGAPFL